MSTVEAPTASSARPTRDEIVAFAHRAIEEGFPLVASTWPRAHLEKSKAGGEGWNEKARPVTGDPSEVADALEKVLATNNVLIVVGSLHPEARTDLIAIEYDGELEDELALSLGFHANTYTVQSSVAGRGHRYYRAVGFVPEEPAIRFEAGEMSLATRRIYVSPCSYHPKSNSIYTALNDLPLATIDEATFRRAQAFRDQRKADRADEKKAARKAATNGSLPTPDIREGNRHDSLRDYVWALAKDGGTREQTRAKAHIYNLERCEVPKAPHLVDELVDYTFNNPAHVPDDVAVGVASEPTTGPSIVIHDAADLLRSDLAKPKEYVQGVVYQGSIDLVGGNSGVGKTPFRARLCRSMLTGEDFFGQKAMCMPTGSSIVWLTQESQYTFRPALERAGITPDMPQGRLKVVYLHEALKAFQGKWNWPRMVQIAGEWAGLEGFVIVDTLAAWARVKNEDDNSEMTEAFGPLVEITGPGLPVGVNVRAWKSFASVPDVEADAHHIAAAGAIEADASVISVYKKTKPRTDDTMRFFKICRNRYEEQANYIQPMYIRQMPGGELTRTHGLDATLTADKTANEALLHALALNGGALEYRKISEETGIPSSGGELRDAITLACAQKEIHTTGKKGSRTNRYTVHLGPEPEEAT